MIDISNFNTQHNDKDIEPPDKERVFIDLENRNMDDTINEIEHIELSGRSSPCCLTPLKEIKDFRKIK